MFRVLRMRDKSEHFDNEYFVYFDCFDRGVGTTVTLRSELPSSLSPFLWQLYRPILSLFP